MKKLIILCGIPGSGKSTFIVKNHNLFGATVKVVSRDVIRFSLIKEDEEYFSKEKDVWKKFIAEIRNGISENEVTVADATHLNEASRLKLINALGGSLKDVDIIPIALNVGYELAAARNENRVGTRAYVPPATIRNMSNNFTIPTFEEYNYKTIYIYEPNKKIIIRERG